jgi:hypothetical protein
MYGMNMPFLEKHTGNEPGIPFYYTDLVEEFKVRQLTALPFDQKDREYCL